MLITLVSLNNNNNNKAAFACTTSVGSEHDDSRQTIWGHLGSTERLYPYRQNFLSRKSISVDKSPVWVRTGTIRL